MKDLNELRDEAGRIATEHGFSESTVGEDIALMHSELSEALEDFRRGHKPNETWYLDKETGKTYLYMYRLIEDSKIGDETGGPYVPYKPCGIPSEIADVIIRASSLLVEARNRHPASRDREDALQRDASLQARQQGPLMRCRTGCTLGEGHPGHCPVPNLIETRTPEQQAAHDRREAELALRIEAENAAAAERHKKAMEKIAKGGRSPMAYRKRGS